MLVLFFHGAGRADSQAALTKWTKPETRPIDYYNVDLVPTHQWLGPSVIANFHFTRWLELEFPELKIKSTLGLTKDGQLYQIADFGGHKRVARKLSGEYVIVDFALHENGHLIAVDSRENVLRFDPERWSKSPLPPYVRSGVRWWIASLAVMATVTFGIDPLWFRDNLEIFGVMQAYGGLISAVGITIWKFKQFSPENQNSNGLAPLGKRIWVGKTLDDFLRENPETLSGNFVREQWEAPCLNALLPRPPDHIIVRKRF